MNVPTWHCQECGKVGYRMRAEARSAAKSLHPGEHLSAYACPSGNGYHLGHLPAAVRSGSLNRSRIPAKSASRRAQEVATDTKPRKPMRRTRKPSGAVSLRLRASRRILDHVRELVYLRDACRCVWCGMPGQTTLHHRIPRGMGGSSRNPLIHRASALVVVCEACHTRLESRRAQSREVLGYLVFRDVDPRTVPVYMRRLTSWVLLDDEGGWTPCPTPEGAAE